MFAQIMLKHPCRNKKKQFNRNKILTQPNSAKQNCTNSKADGEKGKPYQRKNGGGAEATKELLENSDTDQDDVVDPTGKETEEYKNLVKNIRIQ